MISQELNQKKHEIQDSSLLHNARGKHQGKNVLGKILTSDKEVMPVDTKLSEIITKLRTNDSVVIIAETGAGKSTRVPWALHKEGYDVVVTQPRKLAAVSLAKRVADENGTVLGDEVGYHIGGSDSFGNTHKNFSDSTGVKYCTDGLQLIKQLLSQKNFSTNKKDTVLVIDEVHERNTNIEILLAWVKYARKRGQKIKLVCMSATLNAKKLSDFLDDGPKKIWTEGVEHNIPENTVNVEGRTFPVSREKLQSHQLISKSTELVKQGKNVLVFQPGKAEIAKCIEQLRAENPGVTILPLHGELSPEEQQTIFKKGPNPVIIVSTNIAQTSVTIPYIDAVVDSGKERRIELINGVESLILGNISKADISQRAGRAGRCKPGEYYLCSDDDDSKFNDYPIPEIQRTRLDLNYLRILNSIGIGMEELEFFHELDEESIKATKKTLQYLGAITSSGEITKIGRDLSKLSTDVNTGKMLLEATKYGCLDQMLRVAAIRSVDGILESKETVTLRRGQNVEIFDVGKIPEEIIDKESDLLTQLALCEYIHDHKISYSEKDLLSIGVKPVAYRKMMESYKQLREDARSHGLFKLENASKVKVDYITRLNLKKCIISGMLDRVRIRYNGNQYRNGYSDYRDFNKQSVCDKSDLIVADPFTIRGNGKRGSYQIDLLTDITSVTPEILKEIAPHLVVTELHSNYNRNYEDQEFKSQYKEKFDNVEISEYQTTAESDNETMIRFSKILAEGGYIRGSEGLNDSINEISLHNIQIKNRLEELYRRTGGTWKGKKIPKFASSELSDYYFEILYSHKIHNTKQFETFVNNYGYELLKLQEVELLLPEYKQLEKVYPKFISIGNKQYPVEYDISYRGGEHTIKILINDHDVDKISNSSFSEYFEGKKYKFILNGETIADIDEYKVQLDRDRLDRQREEFLQTRSEKSNTFSEWDGEYVMRESVYDGQTQSKAYSGLVEIDDEYARKEVRFKDKNEATLSTDNIIEQYNYRKDINQKFEQCGILYDELKNRVEDHESDGSTYDYDNLPDYIYNIYEQALDMYDEIVDKYRLDHDGEEIESNRLDELLSDLKSIQELNVKFDKKYLEYQKSATSGISDNDITRLLKKFGK